MTSMDLTRKLDRLSTGGWTWILGALIGSLLLGCLFSLGVVSAQESAIDQSTEDSKASSADGSGAAQPNPAAVAEDAAAGESAIPGLILLAQVIALFVLPILIGNYLSKSLRMPDHGWKFALGIGTLAAAAVVFTQGDVKFGPDLSGGSTLIFELDQAALDTDSGSPRDIDRTIDETIVALANRVDPSGTKEVTIRKYGTGQIEIIIPKVSPQELEIIERKIYTAGILEFRITASPVFSTHREIIELAEKLPPGENVVRRGGERVAQWLPYNVDEFGQPDEKVPYLVKRKAGLLAQALVLFNDGNNVTGDFLENAKSSFDQRGQPSVAFMFDQKGAYLFGQLTGNHRPNPSGEKYHLGIVLDGELLSAPSINSKITRQGEITGSMGQDGVDFIVNILKAGSLPAQLSKEPISRETISPTLGAETVVKGRQAILYSLSIVMAFMFFYYRFAGFVACLALGANLLLILGLMVLFKAAFTLPGLAGLVLTIGMSVDANVLIFERIREETKRGTALRMAIRNGFSKATQTIVDANVTTLITAIVIYKIAPDNVKGFGVTLIIGIVMSMYAAIFLSRIVFDIAEKTRGLQKLSMAQIIGATNIDFWGKRTLGAIASLVVIAIGLFAVSNRGGDLLNIDFTGGSSVTMVLNENEPMTFSEVKELLESKTDLSEKNLSLVEVGDSGTRYTISSVEQDVDAVQNTLQDTFGSRLQTYHVESMDIQSLARRSGAVDRSRRTRASLASFQNVAETPEEETEESDTRSDSQEESGARTETDAVLNSETPSETQISLDNPYENGTSASLQFSIGESLSDEDAGIGHDAVEQLVQDALERKGHIGTALAVTNPAYQPGSARRFAQWQIKLALSEEDARGVLSNLESATNSQPVFPLANKIGGRIAGDMKTKAVAAIIISLVGIVAYIWFRFQRVVYGLAAVAALIHDVLVTLGMIALSAVVVKNVPTLANGLMIEKFQISLPIVAAFLTIIGYSLNDTIVVFDRIREVKGKSPKLTPEIVNTSINQTLSRTLLTSLTTLLSVILLYVLGGDGIHGFAFALVVGVLVGTYSSIFVATPMLLWMSQRSETASKNPGARAA